MNDFQRRELTAKVAAENKASEHLNKIVPLVQEAMKAFLGRKFKLMGGGWVKAWEKAIPEYKGCHWHISNPYGKWIEVRVQFSVNVEGASHCVYAQNVTASIAKIDDSGNLIEIDEYTPHKTDYSVEQIEAARVKVRELKRQVSDAESEGYLHIFGS